MFISLCTFLAIRQQWKDEKNALEKQITDLEKKLKGNEENLRKRENSKLLRQKNTKKVILNHKGTRMVKDGED